jgi:hypothetical protein
MCFGWRFGPSIRFVASMNASSKVRRRRTAFVVFLVRERIAML